MIQYVYQVVDGKFIVKVDILTVTVKNCHWFSGVDCFFAFALKMEVSQVLTVVKKSDV